MYIIVFRPLTDHIVSKPNRGKRDEAKVDCLKVRPFLNGVVHGGGTASNNDGAEEQNEHHPVDRGLPVVKVTRVVLIGGTHRGLVAALLNKDDGGNVLFDLDLNKYIMNMNLKLFKVVYSLMAPRK